MVLVQVGPVKNGPIVKAGKIFDLSGCDVFLFVYTMFIGIEEEI